MPPSALPGISPTGGEIGQPSERIAKRLARAGIASRREAETLIAAGRVKVNGKVLSSPAFNVGPRDRIELDDAPIPAVERTRLFLFHKPAGVVTTNRDPEGRRTVFDVLPAGLPRLMTVGRLDIATEGLLLLTNDGGLARVLELPSTGWLRRYRVRVHGKVEQAALDGLREGIAVDGVFYGAVEATLDREQGSNAWLTVGLREGKNREVKNILGALGLEVTRLIRVSYGPFQLGELAEGEVRELRGRTLRDQLGARLIEEAGANFDAPLTKAFPGKAPAQKAHDAADKRSPARREDRRPPVEEGGLVRNRKRERERKREDALGRLTTARPEKARSAREERKPEPRRSRASNVWMAPGARPTGKKSGKAGAAERAQTEGSLSPSRPHRDTSPPGPASGRPGDRLREPERGSVKSGKSGEKQAAAPSKKAARTSPRDQGKQHRTKGRPDADRRR